MNLAVGDNNASGGRARSVLNDGTIQSNVAVNIPNQIIFNNNNFLPFIGVTQTAANNIAITVYQVNNAIAFGSAGTNVGNLLLGAPLLTFSGPVSVTGAITLDNETRTRPSSPARSPARAASPSAPAAKQRPGPTPVRSSSPDRTRSAAASWSSAAPRVRTPPDAITTLGIGSVAPRGSTAATNSSRGRSARAR